jgi:hypothetical protein
MDGKKDKARKEKKGALPEHLELQRTHVVCGPDVNYNVRRRSVASPP